MNEIICPYCQKAFKLDEAASNRALLQAVEQLRAWVLELESPPPSRLAAAVKVQR